MFNLEFAESDVCAIRLKEKQIKTIITLLRFKLLEFNLTIRNPDIFCRGFFMSYRIKVQEVSLQDFSLRITFWLGSLTFLSLLQGIQRFHVRR